ncbi:MAG: MgtC/SapB family protein [Patescibacteria group bacterium]
MMEFSQMFLNLVVAILLGALMGWEREVVGKEAGIRTSIMVAGGAAAFAIIGLNLPYIVATAENVPSVISDNAGFLNVIANIVVGIGFLGAGIIIKTEERVHGLTTAAVIWATAAVGTMAGIGMLEFAATTAIILTGLLYVLRKLGIIETIRPDRPI